MSFKNGLIDFRSDTVTHPTPAMWAAMAAAEVGDDVFGDDPTVNRLQELGADLTGHEAALFTASGTMGNLVALLTHSRRGAEVIVGDHSHMYLNEVGGMAALGGLQACPLPNQPDGTLNVDDITRSIRADDVHHPRTTLVCLENTQNQCGAVALTLDYTRSVADLAHANQLKLHLDGARLFNAAVALGVPAKALAGPCDSVMFCLSKGLCAPVGSLLCGPKDFIAEARRFRKQVGGGMRQAGILAAAGIVALEHMVDRLADDHRLARRLADRLREVPCLALDSETAATNMVYFHLRPGAGLTPEQLRAALAQRGVLTGYDEMGHFRLVTHYWISEADVDKAVGLMREVLAA
jgi:threonine aldolase